MPETSPGLSARVEPAIAALVIAVAIVGLGLFPLTTAPTVRALVTAVGSERLTGLGAEATLEAAESVRLFVLDPDAPPLAAEIDGVAAFDESAVSHLVDVRNVMVPARWLTLALTVLVALWVIVRVRSVAGRGAVGRALRTAGVGLLAGVGLAVLVGLTDFDAFFSWFHGLFFAPGTWTFPESALLIRVFPLPFWTTAGALWGTLVLMSAVLLTVLGRRLCFTRGTYGV